MNVGVLGLLFKSANKGCEALAYSFLNMLDEMAGKRNEKIIVTIFSDVSVKKLLNFPWKISVYNEEVLPLNSELYKNLFLKTAYYVSVKRHCLFLTRFHCDYIVDYTQGDSFTDIYGQWRFYYFSSVKRAIIRRKIPLILGSQTIGPFNDARVKEYAGTIIKNCSKIFVRDGLSYSYMLNNFNIKPVLTTDTAMALPYKKKELFSNKIKVGINVSGLLWNEENLPDNRFDLQVDYRLYCRELISSLLKEGMYEVYLICHVIVPMQNNIDDDLVVMEKLHREFPGTIKSPIFNTPMEAKSYISAMDVFTGARMHATIAAFSSGVPVIPFSYSRKFEGLFDSLEYPFLIHGKEDTTSYALEKTLDYINNKEQLKHQIERSATIVKKYMSIFYTEMEKSIFG